MSVNGTITYREGWHDAEKTPVWEIEARPDVMIRLKRLLPRVHTYRTGKITVRDTREVCRDLAWILERYPMEMSEEDRARLEASAAAHIRSEVAVRAILSGERPHLEGMMEPVREPRDYQLVASDVVLTTGRLLLTDDVGLGKSFSGLLTARDPEALPMLVVTLTHLPEQWLGELAETFPMLRGHILRKGTPYAFSKVRELKGHEPHVLICNYAKLAGWADHLAGNIRTVIFDEAQELRRTESLKYVAAAQIADGARYRIGLTATPIYNYGGEIHSVISALDNDALGTREEFIREWGHSMPNGHVMVKDPKALGAYLKESGLMLGRTRKDVGRELPADIRVPHTIELDEHLLSEMSKGVLDLARMIVDRAGSKAEVFKAAGDLDWQMRRATGVAKARYVAEFVKMILESEDKVVLFGWHHDVYSIWAEALSEFNPVFYTGKQSPAAKRSALQAFESKDSRILVMSLRSGAGLDGLEKLSRVAVFGELDWSPYIHHQCIGRLRRDGQPDPVVAYFLVADSGSDPVVAEVLNLKRQQAEPIVDPFGETMHLQADTTDRVRRLAEQVLRGA